MKMSIMFATVTLTCAVFAQAPKEDNNRMVPFRMMDPGMDPVVRIVNNTKVAEKIGLEETQISKIRELEKNSRDAAKDLRVKMRTAMEKQASLLQAEKIDENAVMAAIDELFEVRKEFAKLQTKKVIAVKAVLTPEQAKKAIEEVKTMRANRQQLRETRGPRHPRPARADSPKAKPAN